MMFDPSQRAPHGGMRHQAVFDREAMMAGGSGGGGMALRPRQRPNFNLPAGGGTPPSMAGGFQTGGQLPPSQVPQMNLLAGGPMPVGRGAPPMASTPLPPSFQPPMQTGGVLPPNRLAMLPWWAGLGF